MVIDGVRFNDMFAKASRTQAIGAFLGLIERKLGITALYDTRNLPFGSPDLVVQGRIAQQCMENGILDFIGRNMGMPDEPPIRFWTSRLKDPNQNGSGGASLESDASALNAALAESIERYIWFTQRDYFVGSTYATVQEISAKHPILAPERFVAYTDEQRTRAPELRFSLESKYLWMEGRSLVSGKKLYLPAQTVSAAVNPFKDAQREPLIRGQTTIGLATWPTLEGARLAGVLECAERDAYMIMWFNQLTLPRASVPALRARSATLDKLVAHCERYGLTIHVIPMLTDMPTHAVCVVLEDKSQTGPRFAFGLKSHRSLAHAAERATIEALRARLYVREKAHEVGSFADRPSSSIGHLDRLLYWSVPKHANDLEFLTKGEIRDIPEAPWENDSEKAHLERVITWCREKGYECAAVSAGKSAVNPTPWHIEMVVMPDLQPTNLSERYHHLGGKRLQDVPRAFGYQPRAKPYVDRPHPYS